MPTFDSNLIAQWTKGRWLSAAPPYFCGVSIDSRSLDPGNLFVAIRGVRYDGHVFLQEAFKKGAAAAMVCRERLNGNESGPLLSVHDTAQALRDMATAYRRLIGLSVIAVTGSVGKTTVKEMVADVLASRLSTARTRGNWNNAIGLPLSLLNVDSSSRVGVFEVGTNHPGELALLCQVLLPDWGLVTTLAPVHLEFFKSMANIMEEKSSLLKSLPSGGTAILRSDDEWYDRLRAVAPRRVITVSMAGDADYQGISPNTWHGAAEVIEKASGERFCFQMPWPGRHQLGNALYAIAVARLHGLAWEDIRHSLEGYRSQPMRWECQSLNGITVVNDAYNANPVSMTVALRTFAELPVDGRKWLVLAGMLEMGAGETEAHENLGRMVAQGAWAGLIVVGELGSVIASAAVKAGMASDRVFRCRDHIVAAQRLGREAMPGDAVLLKASRGQRLEQVLTLWRQITVEKE